MGERKNRKERREERHIIYEVLDTKLCCFSSFSFAQHLFLSRFSSTILVNKEAL